MMKKITITAISLIFSIPVISFAGDLISVKPNYKKIYCGNQEYLGNSGAKRPHLHCGKTFLSYKKANGDHSNISEIGSCGRTDAVLEDIQANKIAFADYLSIYNALISYQQSGCPNQ